jgi:hypothetical protein
MPTVAELLITRAQLGTLTRVTQPVRLPPPSRVWSDEEWRRITCGHRSRGPDDRWHAVVEERRLFLHRSSTGCGIYEVQFESRGEGRRIVELLMCGDADVHRRGSDEAHVLHVEAIIDSVLLGVWDSPAIRALQLVPA